ncbi:MAG: HDIG domain-containing protein [Muribaculaceae bacterium]|nr:HDIG domain-containing protein [Muribaculaceae bacterium]
MTYQEIIDKYYPVGTQCRGIFLQHSRQVADKALGIAQRCNLDISLDDVETAAMLHDIGIFLTNALDIDCHGTEHYIRHGILGAELLRKEGVDEAIARVAERHTGAGLTIDDIDRQQLPLPRKDYLPETMLEKLICYADKFFSKSGTMQEKPLDKVRASMARHSADNLTRFNELHKLFND